MARRDGEQMVLAAFMQASNASVYAGSWRYPSSEHSFLTKSYYGRIGQILEEGKFDLAFFDDRLAMPAVYGDSPVEAVRYGARTIKMDLSAVLGTIGAVTDRLGLGATYSTTYYAPFHVARTFSTLDHLSGGRAAWNVVTSLNDSEAQNFGVDAHMAHDARYDRAEEFMEAVVALWDSWEDDAFVLDRETGIFADPEKVHEPRYEGQWYRTRGPLTVPRSPQGYPLILQAGQSPRGREFAARWADTVFVSDQSMGAAQEHYRDQKDRAEQHSRPPGQIKMLPMAYAVVGETEGMAKEKEEIFLNLVHPMASLTLLSEVTNYDFARHDLDDVVTDEMVRSISGIPGMVESVRKNLDTPEVTIRQLAEHRANLRQGSRFVGTGVQVADQMEEWFRSEACDGFVVAATHLPGTFEEFVRLVVPELQRRGLFRTEYSGRTLRDHLGLPRPAWGAWRDRRRSG